MQVNIILTIKTSFLYFTKLLVKFITLLPSKLVYKLKIKNKTQRSVNEMISVLVHKH